MMMPNTKTPTLKAPFPYYGGKSRWAATILERLGADIQVYVEPFAGSLAVLLASDVHAREVVCDTNGHICNFWRAIAADPETVAYWADYPTIHQDLTARHRWLIQWARDNSDMLSTDPEWFDAKAAGWWVWGISSWIGGQWCVDRWDKGEFPGQIPKLLKNPGGSGEQVQRANIPHVSDQRPHIKHKVGGQGVQVQRTTLHNAPYSRGTRLLPWFTALAERLKSVVVLNRSWESALSPTILMNTRTGPKPPVGILLDPPYDEANRDAILYQSDVDGTSDSVASASWAWALEHGDTYRIAYCCHVDDLVVPDGWDSVDAPFRGVKRLDRRDNREMIMFSPACLKVNLL